MFPHTTYSNKYETTKNDPRKDCKNICLYGGTETIARNRYSYQVPAMVGTNDSTNENHKLDNSTLQAISIEGGSCSTKVGALCAHFVEMGAQVKTQVENRLSELFDSRGQTIKTPDQAVFALRDSGLHDEEGKKINTSDPLTVAQRR